MNRRPFQHVSAPGRTGSIDCDEEEARLASQSLAAGDPTGWFEQLYAAGESGHSTMPFDRAGHTRYWSTGQTTVSSQATDDAPPSSAAAWEQTPNTSQAAASKRLLSTSPRQRSESHGDDIRRPPSTTRLRTCSTPHRTGKTASLWLSRSSLSKPFPTRPGIKRSST